MMNLNTYNIEISKEGAEKASYKNPNIIMKQIVSKIVNKVRVEYNYAYLAYKTKYVYSKRKPIEELNFNNQGGQFCDLAVVTFNNSRVVEYQIRTLEKFFSYPYRYTVFDNSTDENKADVIRNICIKYNVGYIRLPKQDFILKGFGSYSHGIACNYLYNKYIKCGGATYFGLLDHDIFPVQNFDISNYLEKQKFYGIKHRFYIWPGLWFARMDYLKNKNVDFRPSLRLRGDTGACNAYSVFKNVDFSQYNLVKEEKRLFEGETDIFSGGYSYFDCGWIHAWNASNYMGKDGVDLKMNKIFGILEEHLKLYECNN